MSDARFVTAMDGSTNNIQKVTRMIDLNVKMVEYVDQHGKKQTQIGFMTKGGETVILLTSNISNTPVAAHGTPWFLKEVNAYLNKSGKDEKVESI